MSYHFKIKGEYIVCDNGHGGLTNIAKVIVLRSCKHLVRHAQLAEDVESLMDIFIYDTCGTEQAVCPEAE